MSPIEKVTCQELARLFSLGHDVEKASQSMDLKASYLAALQEKVEFQAIFEAAYPEQFKIWTQARTEEAADQLVKTLARTNAVRNYKALQEIADDKEGDLRPAEKAKILETLLKMSGTVQEEAVVEVVKISSAHLQALIDADKETN